MWHVHFMISDMLWAADYREKHQDINEIYVSPIDCVSQFIANVSELPITFPMSLLHVYCLAIKPSFSP